ncbi:endo-1,4-beta-xylanase [Isoptericola sp. 4D.3]|uniref:Beta-xylanase n=1 Tax=Isoptericola peretonis TaxID=2918523 RepID=A0ABT0J8J6_9MICO|nr:endo-1,4-beta-xylanase [Isoptericola sp. 4D.3]
MHDASTRQQPEVDVRPARARGRRSTVAGATALAVAGATVAAAAALLPTAHAAEPEPLRDAAARHGRTVGVALSPGHLSQPGYAAIAEREFSLVVAENAMKWDATEPSRGQFSWSQADQVADFATRHDTELYGHTLVWHSQLPGWVDGISDPADLRDAMTDHVAAVAGRYAGQVDAWDVVNEMWDEDGTRRDSVFQRVLGDGYIAEALHAARAADPQADLCLNDYNIEGINAKSNAMYDLVADLKADGVPVDCVGLQAHLIGGQVPSTLQANLQRFADLGVDVRLTELDIRVPVPASAASLTQQAADYRAVTEACLAVERCTGITVWGVDDGHSWVPDVFPGQGAALLWDASYQPKPAYTAFAAAWGADPGDGGPTDPPTDPPADGDCAVTWTANAWATGYTGSVTVTNTSGVAWPSWTLEAELPAGQRLDQGWSAAWSQSGPTLSAVNAAWNGSVAAGASVSVGYNASHTGDTSAPDAVTVNGAACAIG